MRSRSLSITLALGLGLAVGLLYMFSQFGTGLPSVRAAGPWYVSPGGDDADDCLSPTSSCATVNGALNKPGFVVNDTVLVSSGTYTGVDDEVVLLHISATVSGGWNAEFTTQSGTSTVDGEESRRGIVLNSSVDATIDRFNVRNGFFPGGGGGIHSSGTLTLTNSTVSGNTAEGEGGGIAVANGSWAFIIDTQIYANTANFGSGGGIGGEDGGHLYLTRSWVVANAAPNNDGGGIAVGHYGSAYIENSIIAGNIMDDPSDGGGGLYFGDGGPYHIINSHVVGNHASGRGAAIATYRPVQVELTNTLIISNSGITGIDDKYGSGSIILLNYCDTFGNSPDGDFGVTIIRSNCLGTTPEDGLDPFLSGGALPSGVGPTFADQWMSYGYGLEGGSPAINAGTSIGAPAVDIEGTPRDMAPDIGAYEFVFNPAIALSKTVGTEPAGCATTDTIEVRAGNTVVYCYLVTNVGDVLLDVHSLDDSELGAILTDAPYNLLPGSSFWVTSTVVIHADTTNIATWTAWMDPAPDVAASASDCATVTVQNLLFLPLIPHYVEPGPAEASAGALPSIQILALLPAVIGGVLVAARRR